MGFVVAALLWLTALSVTALAAFVAVGDRALSLAARRFASAYVGDKFEVRWSVADGAFELRGLALGRALLAVIEPMLGLPMDLEFVRLERFRLELPWLVLLSKLKNKPTDDAPLQSTVEIAGLQLGLSVNEPEKWLAMRDENLERFQQAVKDAAAARIAKANNWTAQVVQKLKDLAAARATVKQQKEEKMKSKAAPDATPPKPSPPPAWQQHVDMVLDSFAIVMPRLAVTIRDDYSASGIGIALEHFEIGRANAVSCAPAAATRRQRVIRISEFALFVNPVAYTDKPSYVIRPLTMEVRVTMPYIMQSLLMGAIQEKRSLDLAISFQSDVTVQLRPMQLTKLLKLLRPMSFHADWFQRALALDESSCVEIVGTEIEEYMELYKAQYKLDNETGLVSRLIANYRQKEEIAARKARLEALEAKALATRLLYLRSVALDWTIPSGGVVLPHKSGVMKRRKDLRTFIASPVTKYVTEYVPPPMFHSFGMTMNLQFCELQLLENTDVELLSLFACDMCLGLCYALEIIPVDDTVLDLDFKIQRFGILDERNVPSNVFRRLLDQNPGARHLMVVRMLQTGGGHIDLDFAVEDLTLLVIFDPLLHATKVFMPALNEDEATEMRYLAYSALNTPQSPEQREEALPVYRSEVPQEYSPLILGGMSLRSQFVMNRCEICLLGDSTTLKSHVLAFTTDMTLKVVSSARHEAIEIELVDVALVPCRIVILDDAIDLEIRAGMRTILEIEGEGVDLLLGYKMVVGDGKPPASATSSASEKAPKKSGAKLWGVARTAMASKQIAEVEHEELKRAEEESVHSSGRANRVKAAAHRKLVLRMSDFAMNMSANDLGVLLSIVAALNESMKEDAEVIRDRENREKRMEKARKDLEEQRFMERLKMEFQTRDVDGGGTLDAEEIASLIQSVANCQNLTKEEFDATVREFLLIVDRDGSGDVSLEEFEDILGRKKTVYHRVHRGVVSLTGREYDDPARPRSSVPMLAKGHNSSMADMAKLAQFWERYEQQVGATKSSLNGIPAKTVQKKMVRAFKNYEYAQEAWNRLVNPSLAKPAERSAWLLTKAMDMGSRGNVIDQLLSSFDSEKDAVSALTASALNQHLHMFIQTVVSTSFGGFYIRLIDENLANRVPSIELSAEEVAFYANFAVWEGELPMSDSELAVRKRAHSNDYGIAKLSFAVYGKYYNPTARQVEPFMEYFPGTLDIRKDPETHLDIVFTSDRYFQLNVTFAFMEVVKTNLATFTKVEAHAQRERPHIKEEGGIFWMLNETGANLTYYVVAKKQTKDRVRAETVTAVTSVPANEAHACVLLSEDEELKESEQQSLKEKQLRVAFRNADSDYSGELDVNEVRSVLIEVYEEELRNRKHDRRGSCYARDSSGASSAFTRSESLFSNDAELDKIVDDFVALADTDGSGQVSFEEFKIAIAKMRETVDRFISLEIEGYEPLHNVPIASIGHTQVYELTPFFEEVETEKSIAYLYQEAVALLNSDEEPTYQELQKAFACLRRVREMDPHYEWIDSYYSQCVKKYLPVMVAVHVSVDGVFGLQVKVTGAEYIRNDTAKATECLLVDERHEVSIHNPLQSTLNENGEKQRFFVLPPKGSIPIPLDLVGVGSFAIRQIGEVEWSNFLPLTVKEQRAFKNLTAFEKRQAKGALRGDKSRLSLSSSKMVAEKMGHSDPLPDMNEYVPPGKEVTYPSTNMIDNQPTQVIEKISINDHQLGTWSIVILPQLQLHNVLPCGLEYAIVQTLDCPVDMLDSNGEFRLGREESGKSKTKAVSTLGKIDYFQYVNEVNGRRLYVESGKSVQVFGLDLDKPALMKVRLCASESSRGGSWSPAFLVKLNAKRKVFDSEKFELRFGDDENSGPVAVVQQQWQKQSARSLSIYAPYWIQTAVDWISASACPRGGVMCPIEAHRTYFNGAKDVPLLANAPDSKAMVSVRPFQETARAYESDFLLSRETKKYLPNFERVDWSNQLDMSSVGYKGEFGANDHSFVVAYEVLAAPGQFYRSKILRISPRVIIVNHVPRPLQVTPMMLDKKMRGSALRGDATSANVGLKQGEALVTYRFAGNEKHHTGLRLRDVYRDEALKDIGDWSPTVPIKAGEDYNVWTRGSLGDGPACNIAFQNVEETIIAAIEDTSKTPRYRIENRSTRHAFRYVQNGVKNAEEVVIKPLESHSFVWEDPLMEDRKLRVTPFNWKIPTLIDVRHIGPRSMLTSEGMYSEVYIDGSTRVFAVGDTPTYEADRVGAELNDWLSNTLIDVGIHGFGLTIVDRHPQEVMNMTFENMRVTSSVHSRRIVFSLHHMQIDDMSPHSLYPVVLAPLDTGFNSDKREGWLPQDGERPFFSLAMDTMPKQTEITIVNDFELDVNSMKMNLNLEYMLGLLNLLMEFIPSSDEETIIQQAVDYKNQLLTLQLNVPEHTTLGGMLLYFKKWCMTPFEFHLVFDSTAEDRGEGISSILGTTIGSIVGGIAHVTPEFDFDEIRYENRFFYEYDLVYTVILDIVYAVIGQWYKIVGSVELLGDPVGLATDIVDGFALAARQFKRDVKGKSMRKGESALTIVQTVVGAPMRSIGKVSNGLGDVVKKATKFESQEEADQPRHVPEGVLQSGVVFGKSIAYGVKGFVKEPVRGAKKDGFKGFAKGVGRGTMQLVASPFVGTLGVVEKMSMSVSNTTHLFDEKAFDGTRRPARDLGASALKSLSESNVITEVELHVLYAEGLPDKANPQVVVRVYQQSPGGPAHDVAKYKSSTFHHTATPKFDQSWLIPVESLDTYIEVHLLHKRKPVPKKSLGHVRLSMQDIYRDFDGVPAKILADTKAKMRLRRRKRVTGSILNELAEASSSAVEVRDESWRQRMSRPSMANFMSDEAEVEVDENDDYENDANLLSSRSLVTDQPLEIHPHGLPLEGAANPNAKIFVSIRYVNDMRRYA